MKQKKRPKYVSTGYVAYINGTEAGPFWAGINGAGADPADVSPWRERPAKAEVARSSCVRPRDVEIIPTRTRELLSKRRNVHRTR